jgi:hypothetical protein
MKEILNYINISYLRDAGATNTTDHDDRTEILLEEVLSIKILTSIKAKIFNLVRMTHFWNKLHQVRS